MNVSQIIGGCRAQLAESREIGQMSLLDANALEGFANDRGIKIGSFGVVEKLWRIGLLRADRVIARSPIKTPALKFLKKEKNGDFIYLDSRKITKKTCGLGGAFKKGRPVRKDIRPLFHPFRVYVLYHVCRAFSSNASKTQYLLYPEGSLELARHEIEWLDKWTAKKDTAERFDFWNQLAELAIICEPPEYPRVFGHHIYPCLSRSVKDIDQLRDGYSGTLEKALAQVELKEIEEFRGSICRDAELLDDNKKLHVLLRLTSLHRGQKIKSGIGASMLFLAMAELIRRSVEKFSGELLPEEDEMGFGQWFPGARERYYGTNRVFDAAPAVLRDFMSQLGVDCAVRVRCYVEGATEEAALGHVFEGVSAVEIINLKGQFIQSGGKGLAFRSSLNNDLNSKTFSFILLDGDRNDNIRVVKKAAQDDLICGGFCISYPDFELENFSKSELLEVIKAKLEKDEASFIDMSKIEDRVEDAHSCDELFKLLRGEFPECRNLKKGAAWGKDLMRYANEHTNRRLSNGQTEERSIVQFIRKIFRALDVPHGQTYSTYKVCPQQGGLLPRD